MKKILIYFQLRSRSRVFYSREWLFPVCMLYVFREDSGRYFSCLVTHLRLENMAKWGTGDPRWIVEERADATNVNNWHWYVVEHQEPSLCSSFSQTCQDLLPVATV